MLTPKSVVRAFPLLFRAKAGEAAMYRLDFRGNGTINGSIYVQTAHPNFSRDRHLGQWFSVPGLRWTGEGYSPAWFLRFYTAAGFGGIEVKSLVDGREGSRIFMGIGPQLFTGDLSHPRLKDGFFDRLEDYTPSNTTLKIALPGAPSLRLAA